MLQGAILGVVCVWGVSEARRLRWCMWLAVLSLWLCGLRRTEKGKTVVAGDIYTDGRNIDSGSSCFFRSCDSDCLVLLVVGRALWKHEICNHFASSVWRLHVTIGNSVPTFKQYDRSSIFLVLTYYIDCTVVEAKGVFCSSLYSTPARLLHKLIFCSSSSKVDELPCLIQASPRKT